MKKVEVSKTPAYIAIVFTDRVVCELLDEKEVSELISDLYRAIGQEVPSRGTLVPDPKIDDNECG